QVHVRDVQFNGAKVAVAGGEIVGGADVFRSFGWPDGDVYGCYGCAPTPLGTIPWQTTTAAGSTQWTAVTGADEITQANGYPSDGPRSPGSGSGRRRPATRPRRRRGSISTSRRLLKRTRRRTGWTTTTDPGRRPSSRASSARWPSPISRRSAASAPRSTARRR